MTSVVRSMKLRIDDKNLQSNSVVLLLLRAKRLGKTLQATMTPVA